MRTLFCFIIFLFHVVLLGQTIQNVFSEDITSVDQIIVDENTGDFYLHTYQSAFTAFNASVYAFEGDGTPKWPSAGNIYAPSRNPNATKLIDLNEDRLLHIGFEGPLCSSPFFSFIYLLDKENGAWLSSYEFYEEVVPYLDDDDHVSYSLNESGDAVIFRAADELFRINIIDDVVDVEFTINVPENQEPVYWQGDSIIYIVSEASSRYLRTYDLGTSTSFDVQLPTLYGGTRALAANGQVFIVSSPESVYTFNPETGSFGSEMNVAFTDYKIKEEGIIFHQSAQNRYSFYNTTTNTFSGNLAYDNVGCTVNDLDFHDGAYFTAGSQEFGEAPGANPFAFWLKGQGEVPSITTPGAIELSNLSLDTLLELTEDPPAPHGPGRAVAKVAFSATIHNRSETVLNSVSLEFPEHGIWNCGIKKSRVYNVIVPALALNESFVYQDTVFLKIAYQPDGVYNVTTEACVGRPNGYLELTYADNCRSSNDLLLVNTEAFTKESPIQLKVSPNPADGRWIISDLPDGLTQWQLYDLNGRRVTSGTWLPGSGQQRLELPELASGLYFLTARGEAGAYQAKLMKR